MTAAALWDLDGTLIDSEDYHWRAWQEIMQREGVPITHAHFLDTFGQRNDVVLPHWLGQDVSAERMQQVADAKEEHYRELILDGGMKPLPGAAEWLERLHAAGWKQAIASSAPRKNVETIVHALKLNKLIEVITASEDVRHGKPDPEVFLMAAARLGVTPTQAIVVEDAPAGVEAARRGGMRSIGVSRKVILQSDIYAKTLLDLPPDAFASLLNPTPGTRG